MGTQWNALSDAQKQPYTDLAATLKAAAIEARANAQESESEEETDAPDEKTKKRKKSKSKIKTPRYSGYLLFCKDQRPKLALANDTKAVGEKMAVPEQQQKQKK